MSYQIITFYEFKTLANLEEMKVTLKDAMLECSILGTILIAGEGYNATICGLTEDLEKFVKTLENTFQTKLKYKTSFNAEQPFLKAKVRIKQEIVMLRQKVNIEKGVGTHTKPSDWNLIISDKETLILDARNDYEVQIGTFKGALNPKITKFSDLPKFIAENLNPNEHKRVAMFCTGGIRCEKFAPYLKEQGFEEVYQLDGGILKYLEETPANESLWEGECFVFDDRIAVNHNLTQGTSPDLRPRTLNPSQKKPKK